MSKTSIPSLFDMAILNYCAYVVSAVQMLGQNAGFWKQARSSSSLDILNGMVSRMHRDGNSVVYSPQKKSQILVSKGVLNSNELQRFINHNGLEFSNWIATYGVLLITIISKYLQQLQAEHVYKTAALILKNLLEDLESLKRTISGPCFPQILPETNIFAKYLQHFLKSPEMSRILGRFYRQIPPETKIFAKDLERFRKSPKTQSIWGRFYPQMPLDIKIFAKDLEHFRKSPEIPAILDLFYPQIPPEMKIFAKDFECFHTSPELSAILSPFSPQMQPETKRLAKDLEYFRKLPQTSPIWGPFHPQIPSETNIFAKDLEHFRKSPEIPAISIPFYPQIPHKAKISAKDLEHYRNSPEISRVLGPFYPQIPFETKIFTEDLEPFLKFPEIPLSTTASDNTGSLSLDSFQQDDLKKLLKTCYLCQEMITEKKFFDERRFGILGKCDCVFCYGCIRKETCTNDGVVKGPVWCPSCSVKSDTVAASACWIEGEKKVQFFETFCKNMAFTNIKTKLDYTGFRTRKDDFCTIEANNGASKLSNFIRKETCTNDGVVKGPVRCPSYSVKSDIVGASACWIEAEEKVQFFETFCKKEFTNIKMKLGWTDFRTRKDDFCTMEANNGASKLRNFIRKETCTNDGVVKGPVRCPSYSVKSDIVGASACWIEAEEKVHFLEEFCKNMEFTNIKMKLGWTGFRTRKDDFCTRGGKQWC